MAVEADRAHARLAELVAALSLGIDLGFGQPMEHVLRQCLIALRLAERMGLDEDERAVVYYTALLINVGCHTDAHEQAKWFADDIAAKSVKYDYELRSFRMAVSGLRRMGEGNPPLHRFRMGLEFVISGHREVDGMIEHHAAVARMLGAQLELPDAVLDALGSAYEMWDGKGWPGELEGVQIPRAARLAGLAEFVEVAHRVGGVAAATELARKRSGKQFDPAAAACLCADPELILGDLDAVDTWHAVIGAEPALAVVLSGERFDAALTAIANFVDLKSPYTLGHARAVADLAGAAGTHLGLEEGERRMLRRAGLVHDFGRLGISNAIWDKQGPLGPGEWERVRLSPYLSERMLHQSEALRPLGAIAIQHRERLDGSGYPRGLQRRGDLAPGAGARRRRRLPGHARAAAPSSRAPGGRCRRRAVDRGRSRPARRRRGRGRRGRRRPPRPAASRGPGRPDRAGSAGAQARRPRPVQPGDRTAARDLSQDRRQPHRAHLREDRGAQPGGGGPVRDAARPPPGGGVRGRRADVIHARCIASMFCCMASLTWFSSSVGLNCTYSVPASTLGMWPAGR